MTLEEKLQTGYTHHRAGRLSQAETLYRQVLALNPNQPEALHLLGVILRGQSKPVEAAVLIQRALSKKPKWPEAWHNLGNAQRDAAQNDEAIAAYRQAISLDPNFADSLINLGNLLVINEQFDEAISLFLRAVALRPQDAQGFGNLGNALTGKRDFDGAITAYRKAITLQPEFYTAVSNLGIALKEKGWFDEAVDMHRRAIQIFPGYAEGHRNLGNALMAKGQLEVAVLEFRQAVSHRSDYVDGHVSLGDALRDTGQLDAAIMAYERAITLKPNNPQVLTNLGNLLKKIGKFTEAVEAHRKAIAFNPEFAEAHSNLANVLKDGWRIDEAIAECEKAIALKPDFANAYGNLGHALLLGGRLEAAMAANRRVVELQPENSEAHGGYAFSLHYHPDFDSAAICRELAEWNRRHAEPLRKFKRPHTNDPDPDRRLRIGYVSADFWAHPVGRFLLPLFANHDKSQVEVHVYSQATVYDALSDKLKGFAAAWTSTVGLVDSQMADQIRGDQIDILVDLSLHTAGNRLLVFARKPAPVQMTWLGYPGSTGLQTIDYRLTDPYLDPVGNDESVYSEKTLRLPHTYWCYQPSPEAPRSIDFSKRDFVTLGCLNHFGKVSRQLLDVWIRILQMVPDARMLLHVPAGSSRQQVIDQYVVGGVDPQRLEFFGRITPAEYFRLYCLIDIALDTSPFAGGTTTCDALWMGVPVVSVKGKTVSGRGGCSILNNVGLPELIAEDMEGYVQIAVSLANDSEQRLRYRSTLREKMLKSPVMDAPGFTKDLEGAYRMAWRTWCSNPV